MLTVVTSAHLAMTSKCSFLWAETERQRQGSDQTVLALASASWVSTAEPYCSLPAGGGPASYVLL